MKLNNLVSILNISLFLGRLFTSGHSIQTQKILKGKVVVHVMFIDQCNSNRALDKIQVTVIYSSAILVAVTSECC